MAKISLEVPDEIHHWLKRTQLDLEEAGRKVTLKELYNELVRRSFEQGVTPFRADDDRSVVNQRKPK